VWDFPATLQVLQFSMPAVAVAARKMFTRVKLQELAAMVVVALAVFPVMRRLAPTALVVAVVVQAPMVPAALVATVL
jgi:hypothetical protein